MAGIRKNRAVLPERSGCLGRHCRIYKPSPIVHNPCGRCCAEKGKPEGSSLQLRAAWYGAELFGKIMGGSSGQQKSDTTLDSITWDRALEEIRADFDNNYFVSGDAEMLAYDPQCLFADPFTSFRGVDRFKQNLGNFSKFTSDVRCDVTGWEDLGDCRLRVAWRFKCILEVPWKPILAAAGSTTYIGNADTGRIVEHIEAWDVEPEKVLKRLLKPSRKNVEQEGNAIEKFMDAAYNGDYGKGWSLAAWPVLIVLLPDALLTSGAGFVFQEGGLGAFLFVLQVVLWAGCAACAATITVTKVQELRS